MKNIYIIPTDNYSPLVYSTNKYGGYFLSRHYSPMKDMGDSYQNICITSDEKPKAGDWCLYSTKEDTNNEQSIPIICKITRILDSQDGLLYEGSTGLVTQYPTKLSKIILTTDIDLIKDGIQSIDDEFLEWFVKNPSCEKVEVETTRERNGYHSKHKKRYKIIIPQEEPKQENCCTPIGQIKRYVDCVGCDRKPKQVWEQIIETCGGKDDFMEATGIKPKKETLEEFIERHGITKQTLIDVYEEYVKNALIELNSQKMYSQDEVEVIAKDAYTMGRNNILIGVFNKWFKQFKKK
jgi:hypothetical protein